MSYLSIYFRFCSPCLSDSHVHCSILQQLQLVFLLQEARNPKWIIICIGTCTCSCMRPFSSSPFFNVDGCQYHLHESLRYFLSSFFFPFFPSISSSCQLNLQNFQSTLSLKFTSFFDLEQESSILVYPDSKKVKYIHQCPLCLKTEGKKQKKTHTFANYRSGVHKFYVYCKVLINAILLFHSFLSFFFHHLPAS